MSSPFSSSALALRIVRTAFALLATLLAGDLPSAALSAQFSPVGLSTVRSQRFDNEDLIFFVPEEGDQFAWAVAAGDFNNDNAEDLATGIPYDDGFAGSGCTDCGIVVVRYGVPGVGLETWAASTVLFQGFVGSPSEEGPSELFGRALAAGDFNGDGHDDLAIGDPEQDLGPADEIPDAGLVAFAFGAPGGFDLSRTFLAGEPAGSDPADRFGWALAVGDFDRDGRDDVAVGSPFDDSEGSDRGSVSILMGEAGPNAGTRQRTFLAGVEGIPGDDQNHQHFGHSLAAGDFDGDGHADLVIGAPSYNLFGVAVDVGLEVVLYGALFADGFEAGWLQNWPPTP